MHFKQSLVKQQRINNGNDKTKKGDYMISHLDWTLVFILSLFFGLLAMYFVAKYGVESSNDSISKVSTALVYLIGLWIMFALINMIFALQAGVG